MIKVKFEYDDGCGCKTTYCKECEEDYCGAENELDALNKLYLEFLMACSFPVSFEEKVIILNEDDIMELPDCPFDVDELLMGVPCECNGCCYEDVDEADLFEITMTIAEAD